MDEIMLAILGALIVGFATMNLASYLGAKLERLKAEKIREEVEQKRLEAIRLLHTAKAYMAASQIENQLAHSIAHHSKMPEDPEKEMAREHIKCEKAHFAHMAFDEFWAWLEKGELEYIITVEPMFIELGLDDKAKMIDAYLKQIGQR